MQRRVLFVIIFASAAGLLFYAALLSGKQGVLRGGVLEAFHLGIAERAESPIQLHAIPKCACNSTSCAACAAESPTQLHTTPKCTCNSTSCAACAAMIRSLLPAELASAPENISWAFIGSSTMFRTFKAIKAVRNISKRWKRKGTYASSRRCDFGKFLGMKTVPSAKWSKPEYGKEGPVKFGLHNPGCTDCSGCKSWTTGEKAPSVSYLSVEFARDVEIQTNAASTTQEAVGQYLARRGREICIVSAGVHDLAIPNVTKDTFFRNVAFYTRQLKRGCAEIVWVTMSSVRGDVGRPQKNDVILKWNDGLIRGDFPDISAILSVYDMSTKFPHKDNVHLSPEYYTALAKAFPI